jgi:proteasome accessory factor A
MNLEHCVPKVTGADVELANFVVGEEDRDRSVREASAVLLGRIRAAHGVVRATDIGETPASDPQDRERTFLASNGGCCYIDLDHLELCIGESRSAYDHVAALQAMLETAGAAQRAANATRPATARIEVLANNTDGEVSYGGHLNVLVSREAWNNIVHRRAHYLAYLVAFQVSAIPLTGQGMVGSANGAPSVPFQLSQRADFMECLTSPMTTVHRPLVNTRDEPLCGRWWEQRDRYARLHCIFFDTTLSEASSLLRVGLMQLVLAAIEAGMVDASLALDDPLTALTDWSHDPTLRATAPLVGGGRPVTAIELQRRFCDQLAPLVAEPGLEAIVPRAREIYALWDDTLTRLERREWGALARRLDWVVKLGLLERAMRAQPRLGWDAPSLRVLDQLYASLDRQNGLYWSLADRDEVERFVPPELVQARVSEPPPDTRAWGRAMLMRRAGPDLVDVDWDWVRVRLSDWSGTYRVDLADPLGHRRADLEHLLSGRGPLAELVGALGATREQADPRRVRSDDAVAGASWPRWSSPAGLLNLTPTTYDTPTRRRTYGT